MTHDEMLQLLGLSEKELRDLYGTYRAFRDRLNHAQRRHMDVRLEATLAEAAATFGPDVTASDVEDFLIKRAGAEPQALLVICMVVPHKTTNR